MSRPISDDDEVVQVGTISANNDARVGKIIGNAMKKTRDPMLHTPSLAPSGRRFVLPYCLPLPR